LINKYSIASLVWAIFTGTLTSLPGTLIPRITGTANFILDNVSHILFFLILGFLVGKSLLFQFPSFGPQKAFFLTFFICIGYGFALELVQIPIPERVFEWSDVFANGFGAIFGASISVLLKKAN
jgi:VanZ family protein